MSSNGCKLGDGQRPHLVRARCACVRADHERALPFDCAQRSRPSDQRGLRGIEIRYDCTIRAVLQDADAVSLEFSDGTREYFDLLVGADGLHSNTRALVFGPQSALERRLGLHVAAMILDGYRPREELSYVQFTRPNRQVGRSRCTKTDAVPVRVRQRLLGDEPAEEAGQKAALRSIFGGMGWEAMRSSPGSTRSTISISIASARSSCRTGARAGSA